MATFTPEGINHCSPPKKEKKKKIQSVKIIFGASALVSLFLRTRNTTSSGYTIRFSAQKRSRLTNSALVYEPKCGGIGGGGVRGGMVAGGSSQLEQLYTGAHINFVDLTPYLTYGINNLIGTYLRCNLVLLVQSKLVLVDVLYGGHFSLAVPLLYRQQPQQGTVYAPFRTDIILYCP